MQGISDQKNGKKFQIKFLCLDCGMNLSEQEVHKMYLDAFSGDGGYICSYCLGVAGELEDPITTNAIRMVEERLLELYEETLNRPRNFWTGLKWTPEEAVDHHRRYIFWQRQYYKLTGKEWEEPQPKMSFGKRRYLETHYPGDYPKEEECCE